MLQLGEEVTPLQKRMADFGKKLSYMVILICILFFVVGYLRKEDPLGMLLTSISLAVAAIPEALPALITVALAAGAKRPCRSKSQGLAATVAHSEQPEWRCAGDAGHGGGGRALPDDGVGGSVPPAENRSRRCA